MWQHSQCCLSVSEHVRFDMQTSAATLKISVPLPFSPFTIFLTVCESKQIMPSKFSFKEMLTKSYF